MQNLETETLETITAIYNDKHAFNELSSEDFFKLIESYHAKIKHDLTMHIMVKEAYVAAFFEGLKNDALPGNINYANGDAYIIGHATGRQTRNEIKELHEKGRLSEKAMNIIEKL